MKNFIILYKPRSLDDRVELDVVKADTIQNAKSKWREENRNTLKHLVGYNNEDVTDEEVEIFVNDYEVFRSNNYKASPFFGYN